MSDISFRLAKPCDAKQIAHCHWHVRDRYAKGIFLMLGEQFLRTYYQVVLNDPWEVIVCAEKKGKIIGFASATLNGTAQAKNLKRHKFRLAMAALGAFICEPSLIKSVWQRYKSLDNSKDAPHFVHIEGARGEYWCWMKSESEDSVIAMNLNLVKYEILRSLGVKEMFFEVDKFNTRVYRYHINFNKAEPIEEITLPDGRQRVLFKKTL